MNVQDQVVSLELAKELKAYKYVQDQSYFYWYQFGNGVFSPASLFSISELEPDFNNKDGVYCFAAPTAAELGEQLLDDCLTTKARDPEGNWRCRYKLHVENDDSEANARAKMWLFLKKKGLL